MLVTAAGEVFPEAEVMVEHSAPTVGGYFCSVRGRTAFGRPELRQLEDRMREIVARDEPIAKSTVPLAQAIAVVQDRGEPDKARLLAHRRKDSLVLVELRGRRDYFQGYMLPSTGALRGFGLEWFPQGFLLRFPHQGTPHELAAVGALSEAVRRLRRGRRVDAAARNPQSAGALNDAIVAGRLPEISLVAEALHEARIARIASDIVAAGDCVRVVLIAGPSSSGKTTFSKRLAVQLLANGRRPFPLALDDYFLDRDNTPRDERGDLDFEALQALDVALFNQNLLSLMSGKTTILYPSTSCAGRREGAQTVTLDQDHVIIVEGIHGLNPALVPELPAGLRYRVYVSLLTQLNLDRHNRVSTSDCRLIRRIVRDAATRGYTAAETIRRWALGAARREAAHLPVSGTR